jgi:acetoin utilization protein AcuB/CBS domain-containing protein
MTRRILSVPADATIIDAAEIMMKHKVSGLPVLDGEALVGIITESDIFRMLVASRSLAAQVDPE